jgi:KDO2-lipid IV(A) lauroyltransferase
METKTTKKKSITAAIPYYATLPLIYFLSAMPFRVLYAISDFFYVVMYRGFGYRKNVVLQNLHNSFPGKTEEEIKKLCSEFYRYLCDSMVEIIKAITISKKSLLKRCKVDPASAAVFKKYAEENKSIILVMGHIGNWEWACSAFNLQSPLPLNVIYHPISNKYFDRLMYRMRTRTGTRMIAMNNTYRDMASHKSDLSATAFVADQTPKPEAAYWTRFLNQDTPVFKGTEVIAKKMNLPVVYATVKKIRRGYYEMFAETLVSDPKQYAEGQISEIYTRHLEQDIIAQPETWLWSHRRWKHKRPASVAQTPGYAEQQ